jgi:hypothetical protein
MSKNLDFICMGFKLIKRFFPGCYTLKVIVPLNQPEIFFKGLNLKFQDPNPKVDYRNCFGARSLEPEIWKMRLAPGTRNLGLGIWDLKFLRYSPEALT